MLLVPLALTSTTASVRRLGFRRWQRLHHLAYLAGVLAIVHFIWRVKIDVSQPLIYAAVLGVLLLMRVAFWLRKRRTSPPARCAARISAPPTSSPARRGGAHRRQGASPLSS